MPVWCRVGRFSSGPPARCIKPGLAATSLGVLMAALVRTSAQASVLSTLAGLGPVFFAVGIWRFRYE